MAAVALEGSICSGHDGYPPRPSVQGEAKFTVNGVPVHCDGHVWAYHTKPKHPPHTGVGVGSKNFTVNGAKVCVVGDIVSCGSTIATGDDTFQL